MKKYTEEQRQAILEAYKDRSKTVESIAKEFGINRGYVVSIALEMGAEPRREKACKKVRRSSGKLVRNAVRKLMLRAQCIAVFAEPILEVIKSC